MIKHEKMISGYKVTQFQLGYFSIQMDDYLEHSDKKPQRTLLASNVYSIEKKNEVWILDSGYSASLNISFISPRLKYSFSDVLEKYKKHHNVYIVLTHCHPDHIGGLIETFESVEKQNRKIFINKSLLEPNFYHQFPEVESFIKEKLLTYPFLFNLKNSDLLQAVFTGGHTPEHSVLNIKGTDMYYPADLVPTEYHIKHLPFGEKNFAQSKFVSLRASFLEEAKRTRATILLSHAPNDGIFSF